MLLSRQTCLVKFFELSSRPAAFVGPNALKPAAFRSSTTPAATAASGPTTTKSTPFALQNAVTVGGSSMLPGTHSASAAIPALPGMHQSFVTSGDAAIFQHSACSRPPEPRTRIFMKRLWESSGVMSGTKHVPQAPNRLRFKTMTAVAPEIRANTAEFTVSELSAALRRTVEDAYGHVRVRGEISGFRGPHSSGHCYFALKDQTAKIEAVIWKGVHGRMRFKPQEGLEVIATGKLTTFPGSSKYQIVIESLEPAGVGALMALMEERKRKLAAEGLFDEARKQLLPWLPETIGIVTSPTGAVIRDILHRLADRFPRRVLVWPVKVQGEGSAEQVAAAIRGFNALKEGGRIPRPDLLIVARGGGSLEDLWSFNEEIVVRAAAESMIPLISAVGHETDVTLIDFAADKRAPTPTAAAEMAVPVRSDLIVEVASLARRAFACWRRGQEARQTELRSALRALPSREDLLAIPRQRLDHASAALPRALKASAHIHHRRFASAAAGLTPRALKVQIERASERVRSLSGRATQCVKVQSHAAATSASRRRPPRLGASLRANAEAHRHRLARDLERTHRFTERTGRAIKVLIAARAARVERAAQLLGALSYKSVLARGYVLVRDADGVTLRSAASVKPGTHIALEFSDGTVGATAEGDAPVTEAAVAGEAEAGPITQPYARDDAGEVVLTLPPATLIASPQWKRRPDQLR